MQPVAQKIYINRKMTRIEFNLGLKSGKTNSKSPNAKRTQKLSLRKRFNYKNSRNPGLAGQVGKTVTQENKIIRMMWKTYENTSVKNVKGV